MPCNFMMTMSYLISTSLTPAEISKQARAMHAKLSDHDLVAEFVAPRLWESPMTVDGAYTANDPKMRQYAIDRSKKAVDIARELDCNLMVLWLAREGTYMRETKDASACSPSLAGSCQHSIGLR